MKHRGIVLLASLAVLSIGVLAATAVIMAASSGMDATSASAGRAQGRAAAWSGVQAVLEELVSQREDLLLGADPVLSDGGEVQSTGDFGGESGPRLVYRLLPLDDQRVWRSESALLDLNTASEAMIARLPGMTVERAKTIAGGRGEHGYGSVAEALAASAPERVPEESFDSPDDAPGSGPEGAGRPPGAGTWATVFSFDPNVQAGGGGAPGEGGRDAGRPACEPPAGVVGGTQGRRDGAVR